VLLGEPDDEAAPGSLGVYLTWAPAPGRTAGQRSRLGGIGRGQGQASYRSAAATLVRLTEEARAHRGTGAALTDDPGASGA